MYILGQIIIFAFVAFCVVAIISMAWSFFFLMKMGFEYSDKKDMFSKKTLWNPLNGIFRPDLLSENGVVSRRRVFKGILVFIIAILGALLIGVITQLIG